jgi:hypothetical protein
MIEKKLKNGAVEVDALVTATMVSLYSLWKKKPIVFYELYQKCLNNDHKLFGNAGADLKDLSLVNEDGSVHNSIKNIVLSAVTGDGLSLTMVSPIAD